MQPKYFHADGTPSNVDDMSDLEMAKAGLTQRSRDYANYKRLTGKRASPAPSPDAGGAEAAPAALAEKKPKADRGNYRDPDEPELIGSNFDGQAPGGSAQLGMTDGSVKFGGVAAPSDGSVKFDGNWIAGAIKKPGALHRELGVPQGEKIPRSKIESAASKGGKLGQRARLAETLGKMNK